MIRSMTAFASGERATQWGLIGCELRAVNHRFLDLGMRLPEELRSLEPVLRERIAALVSRGKLDLTLRLRSPEGSDTMHLNERMVGQLSELALDLQTRFPSMRVDFAQLLQLPGMLQTREADVDALQAEAIALLDEVLRDFLAAREREGAHLAAVIGERVDAIAGRAAEVRALMPVIRTGQRTKLQARLADLEQGNGVSALEPGRLEQELVLWLQKLDVDEELDRLDSHIIEIKRVLVQKEPIGRRLDFLLQEFNREANTLGSKSVDTRTSQAAVELKVLIDQVREQIQNIE